MANIYHDQQQHEAHTRKYGQHIDDMRSTVRAIMASVEAASGWTGGAKNAFHGGVRDVVSHGNKVLAALDDTQQTLNKGGHTLGSQEQDNISAVTHQTNLF